MREYIVYAVLVFLPIGIIMSYLLRRQGLIIKYRLVIITASLAIIISFPILMGNLGLSVTLLLYFLAIMALTWFFIKATQTPAWYLNQGTSSTDEVYASKRLIDMTKVQTVGDFEDAARLKETGGSNLPAQETPLMVAAQINDNGADSNEIKIDSDILPESFEKTVAVDAAVSESATALELHLGVVNDQTHILDNDTVKSSTPLVQREESAGEEHIKDAQPIIIEETYAADNLPEAEPDYVSEIKAELPIEDTSSNLSGKDFTVSEQIHATEDLDKVEDEPLEIALVGPAEQETAADDEILTPAFIGNTHTEEDILPIRSVSLPTADSAPKAPATIESGRSDEPLAKIRDNITETVETSAGSKPSWEDDRVKELIDQAFALKNAQHTTQALDCLAQALEITTDEDLSYLLLMEMVNIYKDMGMYNQAEELLFASIGKAYRRTDIIDAIKRQLSYIRMLSFELDRLGLANTPISEVPRLVRKNLAEFVEI